MLKYKFSCMKNIVVLVTFIIKFNVALSFQNVKNVDIVYNFSIYDFIFIIFFQHSNFFTLKDFHSSKFKKTHFLPIFPILKNCSYPSTYAYFWEGQSHLTKGVGLRCSIYPHFRQDKNFSQKRANSLLSICNESILRKSRFVRTDG